MLTITFKPFLESGFYLKRLMDLFDLSNLLEISGFVDRVF